MRRGSLLMLGMGAALLTLTACGTTSVTGSAAPQGASQAQGGDGQPHTVADLAGVVSRNTTQHSSVHLDMNMQAGGQAITATGDLKFAGKQTAAHLTMTLGAAGSMEMVLLNGTLYMKLPAGVNPGAKPWISFDTNGSSPAAKALGSTAELGQQSDPSQLLDKIKAAGTITGVTHEQLNGQDTTHYSITVDVHKLIAQSTTADAQKQALSKLNLTTMPFELWVNSDNLPVKITTKLAVGASATGSAPTLVSVTVNYTKWGQPVTIAAPPADQVGALGGN